MLVALQVSATVHLFYDRSCFQLGWSKLGVPWLVVGCPIPVILRALLVIRSDGHGDNRKGLREAMSTIDFRSFQCLLKFAR